MNPQYEFRFYIVVLEYAFIFQNFFHEAVNWKCLWTTIICKYYFKTSRRYAPVTLVFHYRTLTAFERYGEINEVSLYHLSVQFAIISEQYLVNKKDLPLE